MLAALRGGGRGGTGAPARPSSALAVRVRRKDEARLAQAQPGRSNWGAELAHTPQAPPPPPFPPLPY